MYKFIRLLIYYFLIFGWVHSAVAGDGGLPISFSGSPNKCSSIFDIDVQAFEQIKELQKVMNTILDKNGNFKSDILVKALKANPGKTKYQLSYDEWLESFSTLEEVKRLSFKIHEYEPRYKSISNEEYIMLVLGKELLSKRTHLSLHLLTLFSKNKERKLSQKNLIKDIHRVMNMMLDENRSFRSGVLKAALEKEPNKTEFQIYDKKLRLIFDQIIPLSNHSHMRDDPEAEIQKRFEEDYQNISNDQYAMLVLANKIISTYPTLLKVFYYQQLIKSRQYTNELVFHFVRYLQKTINTILDENGNFKSGVLKAALKEEPKGTTRQQVFYSRWSTFYDLRGEIKMLVKRMQDHKLKYTPFFDKDYIVQAINERMLLFFRPILFLRLYDQLHANVEIMDSTKQLRQTINAILDKNGKFKSDFTKTALEKSDKTKHQVFENYLSELDSLKRFFEKEEEEEFADILFPWDPEFVDKRKGKHQVVSNDSYALLVLSNSILVMYYTLLRNIYNQQVEKL